ncbi:hypothetical protein G6F50_017056 [Rhizopus delemar]|uniref:Uncharacterized protein n=1 Tax=Rhizopus delemar TaxID=936053 RepID=A0A9P7C0A5_9FUNG|nr:hypothetical protein G6F50_017056 [Rhizopus delemar]
MGDGVWRRQRVRFCRDQPAGVLAMEGPRVARFRAYVAGNSIIAFNGRAIGIAQRYICAVLTHAATGAAGYSRSFERSDHRFRRINQAFFLDGIRRQLFSHPHRWGVQGRGLPPPQARGFCGFGLRLGVIGAGLSE